MGVPAVSALCLVVAVIAAPTCDFLVESDGFACPLSNITGVYGIGADGSPKNVSDGGVPIFWIEFYKAGLNPNNLVPIVVMHGGPGLSYDYLDTVKFLACNGVNKVLFYDQAYTGRSRPAGFVDINLTPSSYFQVAYYSREAKTLIDHLVGSADFILFGQSWGGMLSIQFTTDYPALPNLKKYIIASGLPNGQDWVNDLHNVKIPQIPHYYQYILLNNFTATTHPDWNDAANYFYSLFFYRINPPPDCVSASFGATLFNSVVYYQMWGDGDFIFSPNSTLRHWNVNDRVGLNTYPTLTFFGEYDEVAYPAANNLYKLLTCQKKGVIVPGASHLTHIDGVKLWFPMILGWLANPTFDEGTTDFPPLLTPTIPCLTSTITSSAVATGASFFIVVIMLLGLLQF